MTVGLYMICCTFEVCLFICLPIGAYETTDIKLYSFRGSGSIVGYVSACVCICWYDLSVSGYGTTDIKLVNFFC